MAGVILKRTGRLTASLLGAVLMSGALYAVEIETVLDPKRVRVGESATLQIKVNGLGSAEPGRIPSVPGCEIGYRGMGRSFQWVNGKTWSGIVLSFSVTPLRAGSFTVPPITFSSEGRTYRSGQVSFLAYGGGRAEPGGGSGGGERPAGSPVLSGGVDFSRNEVFVGEPVIARYYVLYSGLQLEGTPEINELPEAKGFVQRPFEEAREDELTKQQGAEFIRGHVATFILLPAMPGAHEAGGGNAMVALSYGDSFFSFPRRARIGFEKKTIRVLPLPQNGRPDNFSGNVGDFTMELDAPGGPVKMYDERRVTVRIKGRGNFISLSEPVLGDVEGIKIIKGTGNAVTALDKNALTGEKEFVFTVIPERPGTIDAGSVSFNFFDPYRCQYRTLTSAPILLNVTENAADAGDDSGNEGLRVPGVDINVFLIVLIVLAAGGMIAGMIFWERRKYRSFTAGAAAVKAPAVKAAPKGTSREQYDDYYRQIVLDFNPDAIPVFLKTAEKVLNALAADIPADGGSGQYGTIPLEVREIRDRIYSVKYGGGVVDAAEAKKIQERLKAVLNEMKKRR
jgi:hypothetical protein